MKSDFPAPDFRNTERGCNWLRRMIEASEKMDHGKKKAMAEVLDELQTPLIVKSREPGEEG